MGRSGVKTTEKTGCDELLLEGHRRVGEVADLSSRDDLAEVVRLHHEHRVATEVQDVGVGPLELSEGIFPGLADDARRVTVVGEDDDASQLVVLDAEATSLRQPPEGVVGVLPALGLLAVAAAAGVAQDGE